MTNDGGDGTGRWVASHPGRPIHLDFFPIEMQGWPGVTLLLVVATYKDGSMVLFWPIRTLCGVLGVAPNGQITKLQRDHEFAVLLDTFDVPTGQGLRPARYIAHDGLGDWLHSISSNKVRPEMQENIRNLRRDAMRVVNRIYVGALLPTPLGMLTAPGIQHQHRKLTAEEVQEELQGVTRFLETRLGSLERHVLSQPLQAIVDDDADPNGNDAGIVSVNFTCEHGVTYTLRLRLHTQYAPEVVDITQEPEEPDRR